MATPESARGRVSSSARTLDAQTMAALASLSLFCAMPVPREVENEQHGLVCAPLSHTAAAEPTRQVTDAASRRHKEDGSTRKRRASERALQEARAVKHNRRSRTKEWAEERYWKSAFVVDMHLTSEGESFGRTGHGPSHAIITRDQANLAKILLDKAARQAVVTCCPNIDLHTASAPMWAMVCALEAFARLNAGGYVVTSEQAAYALSWPGLESAYEGLKRCEDMVREDRPGVSNALRVRPGHTGTAPLVRRSTGSHNFGNAKEKRKKIRCLHMLLLEAGDWGLHYDLLLLKPPNVVEHDVPQHSLYAHHKSAAEQRWNAKAAAKSTAK